MAKKAKAYGGKESAAEERMEMNSMMKKKKMPMKMPMVKKAGRGK